MRALHDGHAPTPESLKHAERAAALLADNVARRRAIEARQAAERAEAEAAALAEAEKDEANRAAAAAAAAAKAHAEMEARAAAARTSDEASRIRAEFAADAASAEAAADAERARQRERTERALAARRAKKARELARRQEEELAAEEARAAEAAAALAAEEAAARERAAIAEALAAQAAANAPGAAAFLGGGSAPPPVSAIAGAAIDAVLRKRHGSESADLLARQFAERAAGLKRALEGAFEDRRADKIALLDRLQADGASPEAISEALAALDRTHEASRDAATRAALDDLEARHASEQVALKQRHLQELADAYRELAPSEVS